MSDIQIVINVKTKTHLSANTIVLEIVPVNPRVVKGFRKHNLIHCCVLVCHFYLPKLATQFPYYVSPWHFLSVI